MSNYVKGLQQQLRNTSSSNSTSTGFFSSFSNPFNTDTTSTIASKLMVFGLGLIGILVSLLIIHYTITPIFKFKMSDKGYIPVPGILTDDGEQYWTTTLHNEINENSTIFKSDKGDSSYTVQMDIYLEDLNFNINSNNELRPLFMRYSNMNDGTKPVNYQLGIFLDPQVNDMLVQVRTITKDTEVVKIKNIPSKVPIRIGVVVGQSYFEVYKDGLLVGTRTLRNPPISSIGYLFGTPGQTVGESNKSAGTTGTTSDTSIGSIAKETVNSITEQLCTPKGKPITGTNGIINLRVWLRMLGASEIRYASPLMPKASDFAKKK